MALSTMTKRERIIAATKCEPVDAVPVSTGYLGEWQEDWKASDPSYTELLKMSKEYACGTYSWEPVPKNLVGTEMEAIYSSDPVSCSFIYSYTSAPLKVERKVAHVKDAEEICTTIHTPEGPIHNVCQVFDGVQTLWQPKHFITNDDELERFFSIPVEEVTYDCSGFAGADAHVGDNGVVMVVIPDPLYYAADLFHFGDFLLRSFSEQEVFTEIMNRFKAPVLNRVRQMVDAGVGHLYRIAGPEYATPPFLSKEMFQKYVSEFDREIIEIIHGGGQLVRLHSHGKVRDVLDEFAKMGADATDPLEGPPDGDVTIREAKKILDGRMSIWGNVELKHLEVLSLEDIDTMVRDIMDEGKEGYGFVIMPTAEPITQPLPEEISKKYIQYLISAKKYGKY